MMGFYADGVTWPYDCPHVSGERGAARCRLLGSAGCPVYWRTGACAVCLGEWGAWRAVGREVSWRAEVISEMAREYETDRLNIGPLFVSLGMYIEIRIYLDAVGWSP